MSRSTALILLGVLVILAPFSGLPESWITSLLAILGAFVAFVGIAIRAENVKRAQQSIVPPAPASAPESEMMSEPAAPSSIA